MSPLTGDLSSTLAFAVLILTLAAPPPALSEVPLLPPGYELPHEPTPPEDDGRPCDTCQNQDTAEAVKIDHHGLATLVIDLNTLSPVSHGLLKITLGRPVAFSLSTVYLLLTPGNKDGLPDSIQARVGEQKIQFEATALDEDRKVFRAKNYPEFTLGREGNGSSCATGSSGVNMSSSPATAG